ncbi:THAP domain-containing protein 11 [Paramormyrops kingsleyae]|uniref:THAP domain-containing protein 11 n=1 Tax=Paramormyrops kingsleyae TaxID=1676925 RepID=A0A3B3RAF3_9TELE|nr:THAP domain-containing protein 11 [Paramormyrops kingsleyae]
MPGFTCCVPGCYNNSHRDRELRFYTFPKDTAQREIWLKNISRAGVSGCFSTFQPTTGHRVCSTHFAGGRKTYSIRVPTLFPLRGVNERKNRRGRSKKVSAVLPIIVSGADFTLSGETPEEADSGGRVLPKGQETKPVDLTAQGDGPCLTIEGSSFAALAGFTATQQPAAHIVPYSTPDLSALGALDHPYSLNIGTTSAELLKKLNEQRDIIALMDIKMKEMKHTIQQLKVTEARLKEEVRERDRMLSAAVVRKKV